MEIPEKKKKKKKGVAMGGPLDQHWQISFSRKLNRKFLLNTKIIILNCIVVTSMIFLLRLTKQDAILEFLNLLNSQHPNLKFTKEQSVTSLPFLDVNVTINNAGEIETSVW